METAALAEIKKYTHPGKVVFLPLDTEWWIGPASAHNAFVRKGGKKHTKKQGLAEKHFHFTPSWHWNINRFDIPHAEFTDQEQGQSQKDERRTKYLRFDTLYGLNTQRSS